ncbi:MAG: alpha/beta hydrolase fold domain-containing protein [Roseburia sp.]
MEAKEKTALIIYIPGSAFHRQNVRERVPQLALLAAKGICVALLEYTGSEDGVFPALVQDAKEGIRYMRMHCEEYHINPDAIFTMGDSSGGYTAMMAGLTNGEKLFEKYEDSDVYKVSGIIDFYGPTDITTMNQEPSLQNHSEPNSPEGMLIGKKEVLENLDLAQPTIIKNYIYKEKNYPPVLMFHGSNDELVPFGQSCELYRALREAGKQVELYQMEGAHHGDRRFWSNTVINMVLDFAHQTEQGLRKYSK